MLPQASPALDGHVAFLRSASQSGEGQNHPALGIVIKCPLSGETQQERIMMSLAGKKIVLGVSGGIAAYKAPELVRRLRERGADVRVAITEGGKAFITP
jgi:phosphopantothenoylcysteine decarboxylase/phosphopantothenate--cysteine ligase